MNENYKIRENESELDYIIRLFKNRKEYSLNYIDLFKLTFNVDFSETEVRKRAYGIDMLINKIDAEKLKFTDEEIKNELYITMQDIKKERMKISDERVALNKTLREGARRDTISEIALKCVEKIEDKGNKFLSEECFNNTYNQAMIITLSDFHYGLGINEFNNIYNPEVFYERLNKFKNKIISVIQKENINKVYIIGLGDYISGYIKLHIRLENRENVVDQIINVSESLCQFIYSISEYCNEIEYRDVIGNHSRMVADKKESIDKESFDLLIHQFIKERFRNHNCVKIIDNELNENIGTFEVFGQNYAFSHGNGFNFQNIVQDISLMTNKFYNAIFIGHFHHQMIDEQQKCYVYASGSLSGTDSYANKLRKSSNPSQCFYVVNEDGIECQYIVKL